MWELEKELKTLLEGEKCAAFFSVCVREDALSFSVRSAGVPGVVLSREPGGYTLKCPRKEGSKGSFEKQFESEREAIGEFLGLLADDLRRIVPITSDATRADPAGFRESLLLSGQIAGLREMCMTEEQRAERNRSEQKEYYAQQAFQRGGVGRDEAYHMYGLEPPEKRKP